MGLRSALKFQTILLVLGLIALVTVLGVLSPGSVSSRNLLNISRQAAIFTGILAAGQTIVMLTRGIDLSMPEILTLSLSLSVGLMRGRNENVWWGAAICLSVAALIGLVNGLIIVKTRVPPLITTLAMGLIVRGLYLFYTGGSPKGGVPRLLKFYANGRTVGGIPVALIIWIALTIIGILILRKTIFGRKIYYTGINPLTARLCGINTDLIIIAAYTISGLMAGMGGLLFAGFLGISTLQFDRTSFMLNPIAAAVIGGTTFAGGEGGLAGTFLGALTLQILGNLLLIMRISEPGRLIIQGLIIGGIVALSTRRR